MTRRERFLCALEGRMPDKVPTFEFLDSRKLVQHVTGVLPDDYLAADIMTVTKYLDLDAAFIPFGGFAGYNSDLPEALKQVKLAQNQYLDEWGTVYQHNDSSWPADAPVVHPVATMDDLDAKFRVPDARTPERLDGIRTAIACNEGYDCAILGGINGPFTVALMAMGLENMSYSLWDEPELLPELLRRANVFLMAAAEQILAAGADGVFIAEDLGTSTGPFFRPEQMREVVFPSVRALVRHIKHLGGKALFHSCGNITKIFSDVVETGVDAIHPVQASCGMDLAQIKAQYGCRVCLIGNVDSTNILPHATPEAVREAVRDCIRVGAPGGRFVIAADSDVRDDMPLENMLTFFAAMHEFQ